MTQTATAEPKTERTLTIEQQVFARLGRPTDLFRIDVNQVGKGRARVNVWRSLPMEATIRFGVAEESCFSDRQQITDSFYCWIADGVVTHSKPLIERRYPA